MTSGGASHRRGVALAALLCGAAAIGSSALFVKVSETGPVSTGFWRVLLALPLLWAWPRTKGGSVSPLYAPICDFYCSPDFFSPAISRYGTGRSC
jgi:hypothetical protein